MSCGVYLLWNRSTGDTYIGSSHNTKSRIASHLRQLRSGMHAKKIMQELADRTGVDAFGHKVIEECEPDELADREMYYIMRHKPSLNVRNKVVRRIAIGRRRVALTLLADRWNQIKQIARQERTSARWVVEKAVEEFLGRREASKSN